MIGNRKTKLEYREGRPSVLRKPTVWRGKTAARLGYRTDQREHIASLERENATLKAEVARLKAALAGRSGETGGSGMSGESGITGKTGISGVNDKGD